VGGPRDGVPRLTRRHLSRLPTRVFLPASRDYRPHKRASDPRSRYPITAWWGHSTLCDSTGGDAMRKHREFLEDAADPMADVVFVGCCVTDAAEPPLPSGGGAPRRQVALGGRRVKAVDVHAHCAVPEAMALMGMTVSPQALLIGPERLPGDGRPGYRRRGARHQSVLVHGGARPGAPAHQDPKRKTGRGPGSAPHSQTALWPSPRWRCSIPTWRSSS
jgi:hypothetical protein